jgi:PAS domain-containing protein
MTGSLSIEGLSRQIVACTPDAVIFADRDGVIRFWNAER